jgi:hypothetical protein
MIVEGVVNSSGNRDPNYDGFMIRADELPSVARRIVGLPLCVEHDEKVVVGRIMDAWISEDGKLWARAFVSGDTEAGKSARQAIVGPSRTLRGFSLGSTIWRSEDKIRMHGHTAVEVSLVECPDDREAYLKEVWFDRRIIEKSEPTHNTGRTMSEQKQQQQEPGVSRVAGLAPPPVPADAPVAPAPSADESVMDVVRTLEQEARANGVTLTPAFVMDLIKTQKAEAERKRREIDDQVSRLGNIMDAAAEAGVEKTQLAGVFAELQDDALKNKPGAEILLRACAAVKGGLSASTLENQRELAMARDRERELKSEIDRLKLAVAEADKRIAQFATMPLAHMESDKRADAGARIIAAIERRVASAPTAAPTAPTAPIVPTTPSSRVVVDRIAALATSQVLRPVVFANGAAADSMTMDKRSRVDG